MKIKVSNMSGKLFNLQAINSNTLSNSFCQKENQSLNPDKICTICFSWYMLQTFRKGCVDAWEKNSVILSTTKLSRDDIVKLKFKKNDIVRLHGHGELINLLHLDNFVRICQHFTNKTFALWSKRIDLIRKYFKENKIPDNLILIYSNPKINNVMTKIPHPFHKVFNTVSEKHELENCSGQKCDECRLCYSFDKKVNIIVENTKEYVKRDNLRMKKLSINSIN
tara:strand:- start:261 stop:929 length:669 start_codon:yes stop_codon:yes gene_type:complete